MRKTGLILLLLIACVNISIAQRYRWGLSGGYGITGNNFRSQKYKVPFAELHYTMAADNQNTVFLKWGLGYLETHGTHSTVIDGQNVFVDASNRNIGLSIALSYNWFKKTTFFHRFETYVGARVGITLPKQINYYTTNPNFPLLIQPILPSPILYYSGIGGISYQYNFTRAFGILIGGEIEQSVFSPFKGFTLYQLRGMGGVCYNFS